MTKQSKSSVARRREQIRRQKERQNRIIRMVAGGAIAVFALVVGYFVWQALGPEAEASGDEGALLDGERPLADMDPAGRNNFYSSTPETVIDMDQDYGAVIQTEKGDIRLRLFDDEAPQTVNNFVFLANQGFYDGTTFHRVVDGFMAQGGDPTGSGSGGPGYQFADETDNGLTFDRSGLLAMANAGANTNGSQFFITFVPTPHLNGAHTIFGEVVEGDEVLSQITRRQPGAATPGDVIERIDVYEVE